MQKIIWLNFWRQNDRHAKSTSKICWVIISHRWPNHICRQKSLPSLRWCLFHWSLTKRLSTFYERQEHSYKSCFVQKHKHLRFQGTNIWADVYSCLFRSLESNSVIRKKSHIVTLKQFACGQISSGQKKKKLGLTFFRLKRFLLK